MKKGKVVPIEGRVAALLVAMAGLGIAGAAGGPLEDALRQPVSLDLQDVHLVEVLEALKTAGVNFAVDWRDVEPPEPKSRRAGGFPLGDMVLAVVEIRSAPDERPEAGIAFCDTGRWVREGEEIALDVPGSDLTIIFGTVLRIDPTKGVEIGPTAKGEGTTITLPPPLPGYESPGVSKKALYELKTASTSSESSTTSPSTTASTLWWIPGPSSLRTPYRKRNPLPTTGSPTAAYGGSGWPRSPWRPSSRPSFDR